MMTSVTIYVALILGGVTTDNASFAFGKYRFYKRIPKQDNFLHKLYLMILLGSKHGPGLLCDDKQRRA
jgi:hypothetical protein